MHGEVKRVRRRDKDAGRGYAAVGAAAAFGWVCVGEGDKGGEAGLELSSSTCVTAVKAG